MSGYAWLAVATALATLALITVGALVRTTGSGLGCPDWPLCHGGLLPPAEKTAIIEFSHRTLASVVGVLIVALAVVTLRSHRDDRALRALVIASLPLLALQAWLGKVTVERELPAEAVAFHLATALVLLGVLVVIAAFAILGPGRERVASRERRNFLSVAMVAAAVTAVVIVLGAYTVGSNAGFACSGWPGCPQAPVPFADGGRIQDIQWLHRVTVAGGLLAVAVVALAATQLREEATATLRLAAWTALGLYGLQVVSGALNIWTDFSAAARTAHLAIGSAIWAVMVLIAVAGRYRRGTDAPAEARGGGTRFSGARA